MPTFLYLRLIGFTAGTLLHLFWLVVILGYRRPRNFERVFFFLALALFFFYSGSLLALNAQIYYAQPPLGLVSFAITLISAGLCFLPPLLVHLHAEFEATRDAGGERRAMKLAVWAFYAPAIYFCLKPYPQVAAGQSFDFLSPGSSLGVGYGVWLAAAMAVCAWLEFTFARQAPDAHQRRFHMVLLGFFAAAAPLVFYLHVGGGPRSAGLANALSTVTMLFALWPSSLLVYYVLRYNFLQIGRQRNLVYAVSATFLALLYLSAVRRVSTWLESILPPEATAAILLFVLVIFFEPLQRRLGKSLHQTLQQEVDRVQKLLTEIQQEARQGNLERLVQFVERRIREEFELAEVKLRLDGSSGRAEEKSAVEEKGADQPTAVWSFATRSFVLREGGHPIGTLHAIPHGASLSGETRGALSFLVEQLPGVLDLCRLIDEKLGLERELAERERLALVGQMAASISHNLKNPLGSIKTILQVQLENAELPKGVREDCGLILAEVERLSGKLNQLLRFSRPALRPSGGPQTADLRAVAEQVAGVLRHEAERRGARLLVKTEGGDFRVRGSEEGLNDVVTNLVVNAIEALGSGGAVRVGLSAHGRDVSLTVEDDGPGIPEELQKKILQPFFTTKSQGTGLGLAIVARRVAEMQGEIRWKSPAYNGRGTQFTVVLPGVSDEREGRPEKENRVR